LARDDAGVGAWGTLVPNTSERSLVVEPVNEDAAGDEPPPMKSNKLSLARDDAGVGAAGADVPKKSKLLLLLSLKEEKKINRLVNKY